ncbi:MAG: hypothetical protein SPL61_04595 [Saccharofermentans sp.]|nr:hypothetical protein [Saccharofermentans sp.]
MKKLSQRIICAAIVLCMALPFGSCGKKNGSGGKTRSGQKIAEDAPWFDSKVLKVDLGFETGRQLMTYMSKLAAMDDKNMYVISAGRYQASQGSGKTDEESVFASVTVVDRAAYSTVKTIDLSKEIGISDNINGGYIEDGKLFLNITRYDMKTYQVNTVVQELNVETGKLKEAKESKGADDNNISNVFNIGGYSIGTAGEWTGNGSLVNLIITSPDGSRNKVAVKESGIDIYEIPVIMQNTDKTALVAAFSSGGNRFFELDLASHTIKSLDPKDYEWFDLERMRNPYNGSDGNVYYITPLGIEKTDLKNRSAETVFDFSHCGVNRTLLESLQIAEIGNGSIVLCGMTLPANNFLSVTVPDFYIVEVSKADKNPHAGKTILNLYTPNGQTDEKVADAILKYNETSSGYYIEVTDKYKTNSSSDISSLNSEDEYQTATLNKNNKLGNALAMDLINGEGPDILMNTTDYGQLNCDSYLTDLSPYFKDLSSDKYFTNIIEGAKVSGKLYQMPVCFTVNGIMTDSKYAPASGAGFTIEEYKRFLNDTLNGRDIIPTGQALYFARLINSMSDIFIKDGKVDFTGPEFAAIAAYVKDNVPEKSKTWNDADNNVNVPAADLTSCYGITGYFYSIATSSGNVSIYGIPSTDGRGPMFKPYVSAAVSSQAVNTEACVEFVKLLISDEMQEIFAIQDNIVVNREAFRKGGKVSIERNNSPAGDMIFGTDYSTGKPLENRIKFTEKNVDDLEKIILSCSKMDSEDTDITIILKEEMPAYFLGQKDLNDVITIIQDRVQKVLDERK